MNKMIINRFSETKMVCSSIPLGMHRSVENIQSSHLHSVRNASFVRLCEKTFACLRGKTFVRLCEKPFVRLRGKTFVRLCEKTFVRLCGKKPNHKGKI